jgi:hypothetical protein
MCDRLYCQLEAAMMMEEEYLEHGYIGQYLNGISAIAVQYL